MVMRGLGLACLLAAAALPALAAPELLFEAEVEPMRVHAQTQAVYRVRFYQGVDVRDLRISEPSAPLADFRSIDSGRVYEAERGGQRYRVHERRYAVFPFASGMLDIGGIHATGIVATLRGQAERRIEAPRVRLAVLPLPADAGVPARSLRLSETWSAAGTGVGEAQHRRIRIEAEGVDAGQLPEIEFAVPGMTVHAESATLENRWRGEINVASREESFTLMPLHTGDVVVPELRVRWWDVAAASSAVAVLPARTLAVAGAAAAEASVQGRSWPSAMFALVATLGAAAVLLWPRRARLRAAWRLRRACRAGQPRAVRDELLAWVKASYPSRAAPSVGALAESLRESAAGVALRDFDRSLYGPAGGPGDPRNLALVVRQVKAACAAESASMKTDRSSGRRIFAAGMASDAATGAIAPRAGH